MRRWLFGLCLLTAASPASAASKAVVLTETRFFDVAPDGSEVETRHIEMMATALAAVARVAQFHIGYTKGLETIEVVEAYTRTPSGKKRLVMPDMILDQSAAAPDPDNLVFTGRNRKVVLFPDVKPGSVVDVTFRITRAADAPGAFDMAIDPPSNMLLMNEHVVVHAPLAMTLHAKAKGMVATDRVEGDRHVWTWTYLKQDGDQPPSLSMSTFADNDALSRAVGLIALPHETVTPEIQALADRLTHGLTAPTDQVRSLYDWVNLHIRYVEITLGDGGLVPRDADQVLQRRFGDCKDHAVLFSTLLKAKGIGTDLVLVHRGSGNYTLPTMVRIGNFNHMIVYIPSLGIYADTTDGVVPFGSLAVDEYGKPVLHLLEPGEVGPALARVPVLGPGKGKIALDTHEALATDGTVSGNSVTTATGPFAMVLRFHAQAIQAQSKTVALKKLASLGTHGVGAYDVGPLDNLRDSYSVSGQFKLHALTDRLAGYSLFPPPGLVVFGRLKPHLLGDVVAADADPDPVTCLSGTIDENIVIILPQGLRPQSVPAPVALHYPLFDYTADWSWQAPALSVRRVFTSHIETPACSPQDRLALAPQYREIESELMRSVLLAQ